MKADAVRISEGVNSAILRDGIQKPPRRIKVRIVKGEDSLARVWLIGEEEKAKEAAEKKTAVLQSKTAPIRAGGSNREDEESKKKEEKKADENKVEAKPAEKAAPASKPATASAPSPASKSTAPSAQPALQTAKPAAPSAQSPSAAKK
jgi:thiol:disulfide interchange protein